MQGTAWVMKTEMNLRDFSMEVIRHYHGLNWKSGALLVVVMENNDVDIAMYCLARGKLEGLDEHNFGWTALTSASYRGFLDIVEGLVAAGADIDKADENGCTPLIMAAGYGEIEGLKALLAAGADIDKADENGCTPLISAAMEGHIEVLKALQAARADKDKTRV